MGTADSVGRKNGWRMSASFRETMKGHVEADERVEALHHEADSDTEEGMEFRVKGFSQSPPGGPGTGAGLHAGRRRALLVPPASPAVETGPSSVGGAALRPRYVGAIPFPGGHR